MKVKTQKKMLQLTTSTWLQLSTIKLTNFKIDSTFIKGMNIKSMIATNLFDRPPLMSTTFDSLDTYPEFIE